MRAVVQRVSEAGVEVEGKGLARIGSGFLILVGVERGDNEEDARWLARKVSKLRVMPSEDKDMDVDLRESGGEVLVVPQFTLCADTSGGNRPSFTKAAKPEEAERLYELFVEEVRRTGLKVETGSFGAYMEVPLVNDGPVTILLDTPD